MDRGLRGVIFSGAILSIGSLPLLAHAGVERMASDLRAQADHRAAPICGTLLEIEKRHVVPGATSISPPLPAVEVYEAGVPSEAERPFEGAGMNQLQCPRPLPGLPLLMGNSGQAPVSDGDGQTARLRLGAWARSAESGLALGLGSLGILLTGLNVGVSQQNKRKAERQINVLRTDAQSSLLTSFALAHDLEGMAKQTSAGPAGRAMLVTVCFRFLARQRAFLSEHETAMILANTCLDIRKIEPTYAELNFYRTGETNVSLILPATNENTLQTKDHCESTLSDLLALVTTSIQHSNQVVIEPGDVVITGQRCDSGTPPSSLLSMQAMGEMLAMEANSCIRVIEDCDDTLIQERRLVKEQLTHLKAEDLELLFQPILLVHNPGQFGLELLIRFRPHALKKLGTGKVVELAHDLGIAHRIDHLVISRLEEVHRALRQSEVLRERIDYVSVNISSDSASSEDRLNQLIQHLQDHRVDSSTFCIEITETAATNIPLGSINVTTASERLIKDLNFRILIDDFGSGLSNYRRICEAWYDAIKLDINLVKGIHRSFRLQRYIGSFISTVHALGKTVVCEGVETFNEMATVVRLGADALQGYLISKPLALDDVVMFLHTSEWASPEALQKQLAGIHSSTRLLDLRSNAESECPNSHVPLERYILDNWSRLRSFEEFVLLFVNELKHWGLDILRFSLAFLPDQDDIDCSQYIWQRSTPGKVTTLRFERDFLQKAEHLASPLHYIATATRLFRCKPSSTKVIGFDFLEGLKMEGCSDYLGIRLESRGVSLPVLTVALHRGSSFSDEQIQRIEAMSSLLSLLFYAFESERSKRLSLLDPLTMLANRRSFDSFLKSNIASSNHNASNLALAMIDIDQFKTINDELGHGYGDHCLQQVALLLNAEFQRKDDFIARLGGEEFAIILPNTDEESALALCESLRESIEQSAIYHPDPLKGNRLTVSIGVAVWQPRSLPVCDFDLLQQLADDCLYEAKRTGRNRVICRSLASQEVVAA